MIAKDLVWTLKVGRQRGQCIRFEYQEHHEGVLSRLCIGHDISRTVQVATAPSLTGIPGETDKATFPGNTEYVHAKVLVSEPADRLGRELDAICSE
jgi:hypothetical protein